VSLLFRDRSLTLGDGIALSGRSLRSSLSLPNVTGDTALRSSAVWACIRLRADLISTTPLDVYRNVGGVQVEVTKPPVLVTPDGRGIEEWLWGTQADLDRYGNTFGIVTRRDGLGLPLVIELVPASTVTVVVRNGLLDHYLIDGKRYEPDEIWHERQYTAAGLHVGLSPIAHAAWSIGTYLSAQEFAAAWFGADAAPVGQLRNTLKPTINESESSEVKAKWKAAVANRDVFVTGRDWEYNMQAVDASTVMFLDSMKFGISDAARFLSVPGDMIDAETSTGSITYASITQRNVQLLVINLGPAYIRRERALSWLTPGPRFVKFATKALLRMDPAAASTMLGQQIKDRMIAPSEARELDNREPFTPDQLAEFDRLFGNPNKSTPAAVQAKSRRVEYAADGVRYVEG